MPSETTLRLRAEPVAATATTFPIPEITRIQKIIDLEKFLKFRFFTYNIRIPSGDAYACLVFIFLICKILVQ
jgi:hypothetical protein